MMFMIPGCSGTSDTSGSVLSQPDSDTVSSVDEKLQESSAAPESAESNAEPSSEPQPDTAADSTLVVYFSCTGNTKAVSEKIADICSADIYEIVPAEPYTSADINYNDDNCRANREMNDESSRPAIGSQPIDSSGYDAVFIG